ncbi:MAG TPA: glycosyltransferase [Solirubrobacteraceae bacterium]
MRILAVGNMYPPHHQGGYELMWAAAVDALRARGHDVAVLTTTHRERGVADVAEPGVHRTLQWYWEDHAFRPLGALETWRLERANARAFDAVAGEVDLVMWWAMGGMSLSLLARARRLRPRPASLAVVHDGWPVYAPKFDRFTARYGRLLPPSHRYDVGQVDHWSFNSRYSRDLLARGGVRLDRASWSVEHPGVDLTRFAPREPRKNWRWRLAYVGRVEPRKGVGTALRTLAELPEGRLTIAGAGEPHHEHELRTLAGELGVAERVRWLGPVADPAEVYAQADAVLFCVEWQEPFGLVPLEAMAVGRPVVATGTGGSGEFLRDGENALLVAPGDAAATASAVMRLAQDPGLRARLREGGTQAAHGFSLTAFCDAIAARAERLVAARPK